jgi:hypothetical protein
MKGFSVLENILYYTFVIGWILAPMLVNEVLENRNIILPSDLRTYGTLIWYGIGIALTLWNNRNKPNPPSNKSGPSYTDRGQNDWMHRD